MTPAISPTGRVRHIARGAIPVALGAAALTALFAAQEIVRNITTGLPAGVGRAFLFNGVDWLTWALVVPVIFAATRRYRIDGASSRLARVIVWPLVGAGTLLAQSTAAGVLVYELRLYPPLPPGVSAPPPLGAFLTRWIPGTLTFNILVFFMVVGAVHAAFYYRDLRARRLREADLEARLAIAELNALRMQLQPHFLFNALHTVSSLMLSDTAAAHRVIAAIGDLLRRSIDHTAAQEVTLRQELEFADRYLEVQQARYRERLRLERDVPAECLDALVPSLVLQPLLENAIRHGIEPTPAGATVRLAASHAADSLRLEVSDDAPARSADTTARAPGADSATGIGLSNIRSRLAQLYGELQSFHAAPRPGGGFAVALSLPFHTDARLYPVTPRVE